MFHTNPYQSPEEAGNPRSEHHGFAGHAPRHQVAAVIHSIEAFLVGLGVFGSWTPGDWHEALPQGDAQWTLVGRRQGSWRGKRWVRATGLIVHWLSIYVCGLVLLGCVLLLASWPLTGGGIAHGVALAALIPLAIAATFSFAAIKFPEIGSEYRPSS